MVRRRSYIKFLNSFLYNFYNFIKIFKKVLFLLIIYYKKKKNFYSFFTRKKLSRRRYRAQWYVITVILKFWVKIFTQLKKSINFQIYFNFFLYNFNGYHKILTKYTDFTLNQPFINYFLITKLTLNLLKFNKLLKPLPSFLSYSLNNLSDFNNYNLNLIPFFPFLFFFEKKYILNEQLFKLIQTKMSIFSTYFDIFIKIISHFLLIYYQTLMFLLLKIQFTWKALLL